MNKLSKIFSIVIAGIIILAIMHNTEGGQRALYNFFEPIDDGIALYMAKKLADRGDIEMAYVYGHGCRYNSQYENKYAARHYLEMAAAAGHLKAKQTLRIMKDLEEF